MAKFSPRRVDIISFAGAASLASWIRMFGDLAKKSGIGRSHPIYRIIKNVCHGQTNLLIIPSVLVVAGSSNLFYSFKWESMKVTIVTVFSNASVIDDIEEMILESSEAAPENYTELNIQCGTNTLTAEWFHSEFGESNLEYREKLYQKIRSILPSGHLAIIEDEESQEIMTIGDLSYFKQVIQQAKSVEELEEIQERIDQTEIGNPLLKQILSRSYQSRLNALSALDASA